MKEDARKKKMKTSEGRRPRICCKLEVALQLNNQSSWWWQIILQPCKNKESLKKKSPVKKKEAVKKTEIIFFRMIIM